MRIFSFFFVIGLVLGAAPPAGAQNSPVVLTVDVASGRRPIDPNVYGSRTRKAPRCRS